MARFATPFKWLTGWDVRATLNVLMPVYDLLKGVPTEAPLASAYWRKKNAPPVEMDPDRDGCGLLWCSPVVPNTGAHAAAVARLTTDLLLAHGYEPQMSISLATERTLICVITISYDRDGPGEDERAFACYRALGERLLAHGYPPYRLSVGSMDYMAAQPEYSRVLQSIKEALDPAGILAPGRYDAASADASREHDAPRERTGTRG
jgi:4-cresol dehydrogenase (hydroxylating)